MSSKRILDPCCGSRMMWFDKNNPDVEFCDIREVDNEKIWESKDSKQKRYVTVKPDTVCDVCNMPFEDNTFWHIVLDPPISFVLAKRLGWQRNTVGSTKTHGKILYTMPFVSA